uniref:Odorant receptor n=1 Tax=Tetranychus urticae TaxID=32264 RepID=T1KG35_TETUR
MQKMVQNILNALYPSFISDLIKVAQLIFINKSYNYDFEQLALESATKLEEQMSFYSVSRYGLDQTFDKIAVINRQFDVGNWLIRVVTLVNLARMIILLKVDDETAIYLGDPLLNSKDKYSLLIVVIVGITAMYVTHECAVFIERGGGFVGAATNVTYLLKNGFSYYPFSQHQKKNFCCFVYLICVFHNSLIFVMYPYIMVLYNHELCWNQYNHFSLKTMLIAVAWTITLTSIVICLGAQMVYHSALCCIIAGIFHFHIKSLTDSTTLLIKCMDKMQIVEVKCVIRQTLQLFNEIDSSFRKIRFIVLYFYTGVALQSIWFLHFGIFTGNHSIVLDTLIAGLGITVITDISAISLFCAALTNKVESLYPKWHRIYSKRKIPIFMKLQIIEILNRITLPTNGIQIGDYGLITKQFVLKFLLEFASMLMLFKCNFGSLF